MKKNKEWAFIELGKLFPSHAEMYDYPDDITEMKDELLNKVYDILSQLDEPEVLSEEWITENSVEVYVDTADAEVHVVFRMRDLQNLLVPKQETTFEQAYDKLREESILSEKSFDYYWNCINDDVEIDEPGNLLVPKQELPVIPKFVAEYIEEEKENCSHWFEVVDELGAAVATGTITKQEQQVSNFIVNNADDFVDAYRYGYTVEEKKYRVAVDHENGDWTYASDGRRSFKTTDKTKAETLAEILGGRVIAEEVTE